jgi:hypothetical protein
VNTSIQRIERKRRSIRTVAFLCVLFLLGSLAIPQGEHADGSEAADQLVTEGAMRHSIARNGSLDIMAAY